MSALLDAALAYARRGLSILPCRYKRVPGGYKKIPLTRNGHKDATTDELVIEEWWKRWPRALVGISLGVSDLLVIDVDPRNGGDDTIAALEAEHGALPRDMRATTPRGGEHVYFRRPPGALRGTLGPGVDVKCDGFAVAPPSPGPSDDAPSYEWATAGEAPALPPAWVALVVKPDDESRGDGRAACAKSVGKFDASAQRRLRAELDALGRDDGDNRTGRACWLIFVDYGRSVEDGWPLLKAWNARRHEPHDERELRRRMYRALDHKAAERRGDKVAVVKVKAKKSKAPAAEGSARRLILTRVSDVEPREMRWLWYGRIPLDEVTIFDGQPGIGKGTVIADLVARITTGRPMPGEMERREPASVVILTSEESVATTVRPRLDAAGADVSRAFVVEALQDEEGNRGTPCIPSNLPELREAIVATGATVAIIDPLLAYLDEEIGENSNKEIRSKVMDPLVALARDLGIAIVGIRHFRKAMGPAGDRGMGAQSFAAAARSVLAFGPDPDNPESHRLIASTKSNVGKRPATLRYQIVEAPVPLRGGKVASVGKTEWLGESTRTADEVAGNERPPTETADCERWLKNYLADGPRKSREVKAAAEARGYGDRVLRDARDRLGVKPRREGKAGAGQVSWWELPGGES